MEQCTLPGNYETLVALFTLNLQRMSPLQMELMLILRELRNF